MAFLALTAAIDVILISQGLGEYSTFGAINDLAKMVGIDTGIDFGKKDTSQEDAEREEAAERERERQEIEQEAARERELIRKEEEERRRLINDEGKRLEEAARKRLEDSKKALKNRKGAIAALPTSADLRLADAARRSKSNIVATPTAPSKDELAQTRAQLKKLNEDAIARTLAQENRLRENMENMEEQRARERARQEQSLGQLSLLAQRQARASAELEKIQQMAQQKRDNIQAAQAVTAEANAAVIRAEQEQRAKALAQQVPRRSRLPPSVKLGGSKTNLLKRIMDETGMSKEEAMRYIDFYGF